METLPPTSLTPTASCDTDNGRTVLAAVIAFVIGTIVFGFVYSRLPARHFNFRESFDPYYFAATSMSTSNLGDIVPRTTVAKILVVFQQGLVVSGVVALLCSLAARSR
jgi:hypothetical protein